MTDALAAREMRDAVRFTDWRAVLSSTFEQTVVDDVDIDGETAAYSELERMSRGGAA